MVGDQAGSRVEFFRLATKLGVLERFWSQGVTLLLYGLERRMWFSPRGWFLCGDWWLLRLISGKQKPTL